MISIIIPCYNAEKLVGKCIKSVLRQTYGDLEVIAVNKAELRKRWKRELLKRVMMLFYK